MSRLGVFSYQMLTGELPFQAPSVPALLMKQITEQPMPLDRKRPECPRELAQIVMRCLEKDPEDRWPTADALRRALEPGPYSPPPPRTSRRSGRDQARGEAPPPRPSLRDERRVQHYQRRLDKNERRIDKKAEEEAELERLRKERGEPLMVTGFRSHLAR